MLLTLYRPVMAASRTRLQRDTGLPNSRTHERPYIPHDVRLHPATWRNSGTRVLQTALSIRNPKAVLPRPTSIPNGWSRLCEWTRTLSGVRLTTDWCQDGSISVQLQAPRRRIRHTFPVYETCPLHESRGVALAAPTPSCMPVWSSSSNTPSRQAQSPSQRCR
jgi:hypothetical protein